MQELLNIWADIAPLRKDKSRTALDIRCLAHARALQLKPPKITLMVALLLLGLAFYMEFTNGISDTVNIFMLPYLFQTAGKEEALLAQRWDTALESNTLTSYSDTAVLMTKQKIAPIVSWEGADNMIEQWLVLLDIILGPPELHPSVHGLSILVEAAEEVSTHLLAQSYQQPDMPTALLCLVLAEFNENLSQVFTSPLPVRWPHFAPLARSLTTEHFRANTVSMPGGFKEHITSCPPPLPPQIRQQTQAYLPPTSVPPPGRMSDARTVQVREMNPALNPLLRVGPGFKLRLGTKMGITG